eukprot:scaffold74270_cov67-Phaeocystis_antarctica.AAC.3
MDYEGSEDGLRASSSSIWEYPKLTTTSRATGAGSLDGHVDELPLYRRSRSCRAAPSQAHSFVKPRQRKRVINAGAMLEQGARRRDHALAREQRGQRIVYRRDRADPGTLFEVSGGCPLLTPLVLCAVLAYGYV